MYSTSKLVSAVALLSPLLLTPAQAVWPKRGLAYNDDIPIWQFGGSWEGDASQINWQYNWDSTTTEKQDFAEYVPMLWSDASIHTSGWWDNAWYWLDNGGSGHLLSFNEPERSDQANMSPAQAASSYRTYMHPFIGSAQLGSPAVSNDGEAWMSSFMSECSDCTIDFIATHWYNDHTQFADLQDWVGTMCSIGNGRQVWITEVCFSRTLEARVGLERCVD